MAFDSWCKRHRQEWYDLRNNIHSLQQFPNDLREILVADIDILVRWYYLYTKAEEEIQRWHNKIEGLFKYKGQNQSLISKFFVDHAEELELGICHYCETAYINVYRTGNRDYNHFDLDHFLPKTKCPITALSLFNFVPSCTICNERLKRNKVLGNNENETVMLSPTCEAYELDKVAKICVIPKEAYNSMSYSDNSDKFKIHFNTSSEIYKSAIDTFKLVERYEFHKCEALRLMDLLQDYPDSHIEMIAGVLGKSPNEVREDIFGEHFINQNRRVFAKLHRDIISQYTEGKRYE